MEIMRDGAVPVAAAFHHFPLSPATDRTHGEILEAAHKVRFEFDPASTRPFAIVIHGRVQAMQAARHTVISFWEILIAIQVCLTITVRPLCLRSGDISPRLGRREIKYFQLPKIVVKL